MGSVSMSGVLASCPHRDGNSCGIANKLTGAVTVISQKTCEVCCASDKPMQQNKITCSLAVAYMLKHDKIIPPELLIEVGVDPRVMEGPGTELKKMISWFGIKPTTKKKRGRRCKCAEHVQRMNQWGPDECERRIETIVRWLRHSARVASLPFVETAVRALIKGAISRSRAKLKPIHVIKPVRQHDKRWAIAVTTAPRKDCTLLRCIESIRKCGWEPVVFAEPGSTKTDCVTFWNETRKGVWHNWRQAAEWCLAQNTEFVMTVQDDALFHPDTRTFANEILWTSIGSVGYVSFYTPMHYQQWQDGRQRPFGIYPVNTNSVWGAMALTFPPKVLRELLDHPRALSWLGAKLTRMKGESVEEHRARDLAMKERRKKEPWLIQNSDTAIGIILRKFLKKKLVYVSPSPVDHCSKYSSIGHGGNDGKRNAYYIADPTKPLRPQVLGTDS